MMSFFILNLAIGYGEDSYKEKIAEAYDKKTGDVSNLNFMLAENDHFFFNHNGLVASGDFAECYASKIENEKELLSLIHLLEKNNVYNALPYLGCPTEDSILLDAGCGAGGCGLMIHEAFRSHIEGFTLSKGQADFANNIATQLGYQDKVNFFQGDMLNINRPDNYYDFIWACESTEHAPNLREMFAEFARVSKPNARLVIIAWCAHDPKLKETVDEHYLTQIHSAQEYLAAALEEGWLSLTPTDLTDRTATYWQIRALSKNATGAEEFMGPGFASRNLQYFLFTFENKKT